MNDPDVAAALAAKRADLEKQIKHHRTMVRRLSEALVTLDAAVRLFDAGQAPMKRRYVTSETKPSYILLAALREAGGPRSALDLTPVLMAARGLDQADKKTVQKTSVDVGSCLRHLRARGIVTSSMGTDGLLVWEVALA